MRIFAARALLGLILTMISALPLRAAELVMVEQPGCHWCEMWNAEVSSAYPKTPEGAVAPLRRVQLAAIRKSGIGLARPVMFTPTFVLVEDGQELARIEGYPGEDFFWGLLDMMLSDHTAFAGSEGS